MSNKFTVSMALLVGAMLFVYAWSLFYPWVYDDWGSIVENDFLDNPARIVRVLTGQTLMDDQAPDGRRPATVLTYFIDRALWGDRAFGFRLTNLLWHGLNVWLLFLLLCRLLKNHGAARLGAVVFALHPVMVEAVHMPAFREDLLVTAGILGSLVLWTRPASRRGGLRVWGVLGCWLWAACAKESGIVAPLIAAAGFVALPETRPRKREGFILAAGAFVLWAGTAVGWIDSGIQALGGHWNGRSFVFPENLQSAPWMVVRQLGLVVWPFGYAVDYAVRPVSTALSWRFAAGLAGCAALVAVGIAAWRRGFRSGMLFGWWAGAALLTTSNVLPLLNPLANRYLYLPMAGLAGVAAAASCRLVKGPTRWRTLGLPLLTGLLLTGLTVWELRHWRTEREVWERTARLQPDSSRAQVWLGLFAMRNERFEEATGYFKAALDRNARQVSARLNLGIAAARQGRLPEAVEHFQQAVEDRPDKAQAWLNLGMAYMRTGRPDAGLPALEKAVALEPWQVEPRRQFMLALLEQQQYKRALDEMSAILRIDPRHEEVRENRARLETFIQQ